MDTYDIEDEPGNDAAIEWTFASENQNELAALAAIEADWLAQKFDRPSSTQPKRS